MKSRGLLSLKEALTRKGFFCKEEVSTERKETLTTTSALERL